MPNTLSQLADYRKLWVLTGAGCSVASGIPAYRDAAGNWLYAKPIQHQQFLLDYATRQRYWARSTLGWHNIRQAAPNLAHQSLVELEAQGRVSQLVTQNVDGLHQQAGQQKLIELHGCLHRVVCLDCGEECNRQELQAALTRANISWQALTSPAGPDGDITSADTHCESFQVPVCRACRGILKPDVVFFGDSVPRNRVESAMQSMLEADAVLVVGSSLQVYSGFRFVQAAVAANIPVILINKGVTRADHLAKLRINADCAIALAELAAQQLG